MTPEKEHKKGGSRLAGSTPERRAKKPRKPLTSKQKALRAAYITVTVLAAIVVVVFAASKLLFIKPEVSPSGELPQVPAESGSLETETPSVYGSGRKEDFFTFLVIGRDTGGGGNTDTILLAAYDVPNQKLNVMSVPRDTMVNVSWDIKRINSVYNMYGGGDDGIEALDQEISQLVGFVPDFQVVVEWEAVGELVDALDGVWFDVPRDMNYDDPTQDLHIHLEKGYQLLDGEAAMGVIRYRHDNDSRYGYPDGDLGRIKTQQAFLTAVVEQCLQITNVTRIGELAEVFNNNVTTNLSMQNLLWFAQQAIFGGLKMENVSFVTMPCTNESVWSRSYGNMQSYVVPSTDELVDLVNQCFNPYLEELSSRELDIMYVNSDGTIGSSTGRLEDTTHNSAWIEWKNRPQETDTPEETGTPGETDTPEETGTPGETGAPEETGSPAPEETETPVPGETETPAPGETETPAPEETGAAPAESAAPEETSSPEPVEPPPAESDTPGTDGPPEGIPIL